MCYTNIPLITKHLTIALILILLTGCGMPAGRAPQTRPAPESNERRISLEIGSLILRGTQPRNVIMFLHKHDSAVANGLTEYPKDQYIMMQPGDREDIQESFIGIPESLLDKTRVIATIVAVPDAPADTSRMLTTNKL